MSNSRNDPDIRKGSLLLSTLVLTPDSALETYLTQRVTDRKVTVEQLKRVREALDGIAFAIRGNSQVNWQRIDDAWEILRRIRPPKPAAARDEPPVAPPRAAGAVSPAPAGKLASPAGQPPAPIRPPMAPHPAPAALPAAAAAPIQPPLVGRIPPTPPTVVVSSKPALAAAPIVDATVVGAVLPIDQTLPFEGSSETPSSALEELEPLQEHDLDGTAALGMHLHLEDVLPFDDEPKPAPCTPTLTLEQYASLSAERSVFPDRNADTHQKYRLTGPGVADALDASWQARLAAEPGLNERFHTLVTQYISWIRSRGE